MSCQKGNSLRSAVIFDTANLNRVARLASKSADAYARHSNDLASARAHLTRQRTAQSEHLATCIDCDGGA